MTVVKCSMTPDFWIDTEKLLIRLYSCQQHTTFSQSWVHQSFFVICVMECTGHVRPPKVSESPERFVETILISLASLRYL